MAIWKKSDLTRAIHAARAAGATLQRIEIDPNGRIIMILVDAEEAIGSVPDGIPYLYLAARG